MDNLRQVKLFLDWYIVMVLEISGTFTSTIARTVAANPTIFSPLIDSINGSHCFFVLSSIECVSVCVYIYMLTWPTYGAGACAYGRFSIAVPHVCANAI